LFVHATLLKAGPWFQYILNIINVAGSADADTRRRVCGRYPLDTDPEFQDPHISALWSLCYSSCVYQYEEHSCQHKLCINVCSVYGQTG